MKRKTFFIKSDGNDGSRAIGIRCIRTEANAAEGDDAEIGYITVQPRGVYLQSGYSQISKVGDGKIAAGGTTSAQKVVSEVQH